MTITKTKFLSEAPLTFTFDDFIIVPQYSDIPSRKSPDISTTLGKTLYKIPIVSSPMNTVTENKMLDIMFLCGGLGVLHRYMTIENQIRMSSCEYGFVAVGADKDWKNRVSKLFDYGIKKFCVDVATGHTSVCISAVEKIRNTYPDVEIMAGDVASFDGTKDLVLAGADIIRVGIGPGSMCTTRLVTGHGLPQLSALEDCCRIKESHPHISIIADGGIRYSGDAVKALAIGADAIMIGGLLAGTEQSPGEICCDENGSYKRYCGMASEEARESWFNGAATSFVPEGSSTRVPYKGDAKKVIEDLAAAIKVGLSYSGAMNLKQLREKAIWARITENGRIEGTPNTRMYK